MPEEKIINFDFKKTPDKDLPGFDFENIKPENKTENEKRFNGQVKEKTDKTSNEVDTGEGEIGQVKITDPKSGYKKRQKDIENVLAKDLEDTYKSMPLATRKLFKQKGEYTATKINELLEKTKVKTGKIISLIIKWLKIIPGVNKYFLEQEAKIKADEIIKLKKN